IAKMQIRACVVSSFYNDPTRFKSSGAESMKIQLKAVIAVGVICGASLFGHSAKAAVVDPTVSTAPATGAGSYSFVIDAGQSAAPATFQAQSVPGATGTQTFVPVTSFTGSV